MNPRTLYEFVIRKMKQHPHLVCVAFSIILWILRHRSGANGALQTRMAAPPQPLSSNGSKVTDCWSGSLVVRDYMLSTAEVALVFYYAPWCGKSVDSFRELEAAAEVLHKQATFIAVNCWWTQGECRGAMQFHHFPQVYLHHKNMKHAVFYNGPLKKDYFVDVLLKAMDPVCYLSTTDMAEQFLRENQFTVMGYFSFSSGELPGGFLNYSVLAVKHLETYDVPVQFGAVTDASVAKVYYLKPEILQLRDRLRPREVTYLGLNSTVKHIAEHLRNLRGRVAVPDIHLPGVKSNFLYGTMHKGPTLVTFVSSSEMSKRQRYLKKVQQLVFQYLDCERDLTSPITTSVIYKNISLSKNSCCKSTFFKSTMSPDDDGIVCNSCVKRECRPGEGDSACIFYSSLTKLPAVEQWCGRIAQNAGISWDTELCAEFLPLYDRGRTRLNVCCTSSNFFFSEIEKQRTHYLSHSTLVDEIVSKHPTWSDSENSTTIVDTSEEDLSIIFMPQNDHLRYRTTVSGLGCETNRTLQFLTMDFERHGHLSQTFGVQKHTYSVDDAMMGAVIIDPTSEVHHVMSSSHFHLENFIINYTLGILPRSYHHKLPDKVQQCHDQMEPCIHELTSLDFEGVVMDNQKDVLLLYYVPWCLACTSMSHVFLSLANLLQPSTTAMLARIDAFENELPWQYTVESYPTVILFPAKRSSYSVVFPHEEDITVANLLRFLFKNISRESTKQILMNMCLNGKGQGLIQHEACQKWNMLRKTK